MKREREGCKGIVKVFQCERGKPYPTVTADFVNLPVWSRGAYPWKNLSPFVLKTEDGVIFENEWQRYKVYAQVEEQRQGYCNWHHPAEVHYDVEHDVFHEDKWRAWSEKIRNHKEAVRRPNGRNAPLFAYYNGERLDVVQARKKIYIPMLQEIYRRQPEYKKILEMLKDGKSVILIEPDGPPTPDPVDVDIPFLERLQDMTKRSEFYQAIGWDPKIVVDGKRYFPYGHGYVLALTLLQDLQKEEDECRLRDAKIVRASE